MTTTLQRELALIPARVARGVKLLDAKRPGWRQDVNANRLRMTTCRHCVLGQVFGHYGNVAASDFIDTAIDKRIDAGFTAPSFTDGSVIPSYWVELETEWRRVLAEKSK